MTRNGHIHIYLEEKVIENVTTTEEDSENDDNEREGYAHDVPGSIGFEMDLNNNLGGCDVRLNDEDMSEGG
ncbi:hypothetical protein V6N13_148562 [Hibiscus sabdariffa]